MTGSSHRVFNLSAALAISFHWPVWALFLLAASLPDRLEPAEREIFREPYARGRSHRAFFHTYSSWILVALGILWLPAALQVWAYTFLAGVFCHLLADTGSRQGCSVLLPCHCGKLGYCRCPWYARRWAFKWYRTGDFSEGVCLFLFCGLCAGIAAWRWKEGWDILGGLNPEQSLPEFLQWIFSGRV